MLVLSRKCEQSLLVGEDITITVLAIDGERVKLGIEAPRSVTVSAHRSVYDQIQSANADAARTCSRRRSTTSAPRYDDPLRRQRRTQPPLTA